MSEYPEGFRRLVPLSLYHEGMDAYVDPQGVEQVRVVEMVQRRNRVLDRGFERCPRCDGLGFSNRDVGPCALCKGTGTTALKEV